jgi:predicted SprT family Zn-dependent metalloprotease
MRLYQDTAPTEVKIDNITYTLSWIDADSKEGKEYLGRHDPSNSEIRLNRALTLEHARDVLLHEIVHAFLWKGGLHNVRRVDDAEELVCTILPSAMIRLHRDNPVLWVWLFPEKQ